MYICLVLLELIYVCTYRINFRLMEEEESQLLPTDASAEPSKRADEESPTLAPLSVKASDAAAYYRTLHTARQSHRHHRKPSVLQTSTSVDSLADITSPRSSKHIPIREGLSGTRTRDRDNTASDPLAGDKSVIKLAGILQDYYSETSSTAGYVGTCIITTTALILHNTIFTCVYDVIGIYLRGCRQKCCS